MSSENKHECDISAALIQNNKNHHEGLKLNSSELDSTCKGACGDASKARNLPEGDATQVSENSTETQPSDNGEHKNRCNILQRPKSVSFHSGSSLPAERKISNAVDCLHYMVNGSSLIKVKASSRQYRRFFTLEEDLSAIRWIPSSKKLAKARLPIRCIREVRMGKSTEVLRSKEITGTYSEDCAFSIIYNETFESLDLIAATADEANIWVTGLNVLIGASRSPDTLDERQRMREKWLKEMFEQADTNQKGLLSEHETISLIKKLNKQLSTVRLRQKIMEFEHGKLGEERGRIDSSDFVNIFKETSTRPEIYFLLVRYSGKDYMTLEDFQLFLEGEQGMSDMTADKCLDIIKQYEPSLEARQNKQMLIDGFTLFLLSEECDVLHPKHRKVCQDMTRPLAHYFISSSHNTYLLEDQLKGPSGVEGYVTALKMGCRCVKVDCWDSTDGPVVYHGNTLTSKIPLADVLVVINENAFVASSYPLIIHLENHCSPSNQIQVAALFKDIFKDRLVIPKKDGKPLIYEMSPANFSGKIIIKGKKILNQSTDDGEVSDEDDAQETSGSKAVQKIKLSRALSDLVSLTRTRFLDFELTEDIQSLSDVSSFPEIMAVKLAQGSPEELANHNKSFLTHVFPNSSRVDSSNFNPLDFWSCGCQMVSMNFQTAGQMMDLYQGWFQQNGGCGYVLKPFFLREQQSLFSALAKDPLPGLDPTTLYIKIISAQQLPHPKGASSKASAIDPYVIVEVFGVPADCAEVRTKTVSNEGHSPIFDESFEFTVTVAELAVLRIIVLDDEFIGDDFIGQYTIPLKCLQAGYRHVRLYSNNGDALCNSTLFIYVAMSTRADVQKCKKKKSWINMKPVGIKQVDEIFKNAFSVLTEAQKLRLDEEQAMVDLCKECGLSDSGNIVQCLRVLSLRMASSQGVSGWEVVTSGEKFATLKVRGELSLCLNKAVGILDKVLAEHASVTSNADNLLKSLNELYISAEKLWDELITHCASSGTKGRKAEKAMENFLFNMSVLRAQTDLLKATRDECILAVQQVSRLGPVLNNLFHKERESINSAAENTSAGTPVLNAQTLAPFSQQPPLTPTSPCDGRLRGILKKSGPMSAPAAINSADKGNTNTEAMTSVFFPVPQHEGSNR